MVETAGRVLCLYGPADGVLLVSDAPAGTILTVRVDDEVLRYRLTDGAVGCSLGWARAAELVRRPAQTAERRSA